VKGVVLNDGTTISTEDGILNIFYRAIDIQETHSLFRSELNVVYNVYGYQQENTTNCWSLGCVYQNAGVPPFTMILKGRTLVLVNTIFVWNLPGEAGKIIKYLLVD
jgi:hypothetical protein